MHHSTWKAKQSHRGLRAGQYQKGNKSVSEQLNHIYCSGNNYVEIASGASVLLGEFFITDERDE